MVYAIPSYKRSDRQDTLSYLTSVGVPRDRIFIFVQTENEYSAYKEKYSDKCNIVYRYAETVPEARNNILRFFERKENIVMMDDDISMFSIGSKKTKFVNITGKDTLETILKTMFEYTEKTGGYLFGLYPVYNEYFMSDNISTKVTVNTVIGIPKGFPYLFDERYIAKEDIELCGRILDSGGKIVRFNNVAFKAKHRTNAGGAFETWKSDANIRLSRELVARFPKIFGLRADKPKEVRMVIKDQKMKGIKWTLD